MHEGKRTRPKYYQTRTREAEDECVREEQSKKRMKNGGKVQTRGSGSRAWQNLLGMPESASLLTSVKVKFAHLGDWRLDVRV